MKVYEIIRKVHRLGFRLGFMKMIGYEGVFTCCYRDRNHCGDDYISLPYSAQYWYADPLSFIYENEVYVFMEAFDRSEHLGRIAYAKLTEHGWGEVTEVIAESFHLSFPTIFRHGDSIYMLPETSTASKAILYCCTDFPDRWEKVAEFLEGKQIVDSVILTDDVDSVTILASECNPDNPLMAKFFKYKIEIEKNEKTYNISEDKEFNRQQQYSFYHRNAGAISQNGIIPLQKSTPAIYGYAVLFIKADQMMKKLACDGKITERDIVKEILPTNISVGGKKRMHPMGVQTYSESKNYEIIDVQYLEFNAKKWKHRKM